jgi:rhamnosyltransferase
MVSVVVLTLNAGERLRSLFEALLPQTVPLELMVVDSSSNDNTLSIAEAYGARVATVQRSDFDHGTTRNFGLLQTSGDFVVFLTQDVVPAGQETLERLIAPFFADELVGCVYGRQLPSPGATVFAAHSRIFNYGPTSLVKCRENGERGIKVPFLSNSFAAYRRNALEEIGLFKEDLISTEDTYAGARMLLAGYRIAYAANAMVYHSHNYTVLEEFRRYFDIGVFHRREKWIMETFGRAEGEGSRFLLSELQYIVREVKYGLLPEFIIRNILKYLGFFLGRQHEKLPLQIIKKISNNKNYWTKKGNRL